MIVAPHPINNKTITRSSEASYLSSSGKKIRKIEFKRLDVFGTNINNPGVSNTNKIEDLLNKTHIYTNEKIIKKNLIFSEGD